MDLKRITLLTAAMTLAGCSTLETEVVEQPQAMEQPTAEVTEQPTESEAEATVVVEPEIPDLPIDSFTPETLYSLLVAELAGQRERYDIFLSSYLHQAEKTRDPGIAKRATQIALYLDQSEAALKAAQIWAQSAPWDTSAQQMYTFQLINNDQLDIAFDRMEQELLDGGDPHFEQLALEADQLSSNQRSAMLYRMDQLLEQYPDHIPLLLAKTLLLEIDNQLQPALATAETLYQKNPNDRTLLIKVKLLQQLSRYDEAEQLVNEELAVDPNNVQFRLVKAELLVSSKQYQQAQAEYEKIAILSPQNSRVRLSLASLALHNNDLGTAKKHLIQLLEDPEYQDEAYYQLGRLAETEGDPDAAVDYFSQVQQGDMAIAAYTSLGDILIAENRLEDLHQYFERAREQNPNSARRFYLVEADLLNQNQFFQAAHLLLSVALTDYPQDSNLLYARAMTAERMADLDGLEQDLRTILSQEPDNAMVLNALGYTLVDQTNRHQEALALIVKANDLMPEDPAITDSLGWAMFKMGQYNEAVALLRKAYSLYPDPEIAAHLGEALHASGETDQALALFRDALDVNPNSDILLRTLNRLDINLTP